MSVETAPAAAYAAAPRDDSERRARLLTGLSVLAALVVCAVFVLWDLPSAWEYVLELRARKVAALALVAVAVAVSTVLFQTVTANTILTPGIMGFDALHLLIATLVVFTVGSGANAITSADGARALWALETTLMVVVVALLSQWLFVGARRDLHVLVLVGIVVGTLFRSVTSLLQRMLDPTQFAVLQDSFFASFNTVDETLLGLSAIAVGLTLAAVFRLRATLDVLALGREVATSLGVDHRRTVMGVLVAVAVLVSVSTALVGPITFFGLLVAHLAYRVVGHRHRHSLPTAAALAVVTLVLGQLLLERVFSYATGLSIIIDFAGGVLFLALVLRRSRR